jgi:putative DNA modification/repair radical SAM protein
MEQTIAVARKLRVEHGFKGYIHLKTIPEASQELINEAGKWADRISINIELPTPADLARLAPEKNIARIETSMDGIQARIVQGKAERKESRKAPLFAPAGQSTQMIVGATPTPDREILERASGLYQKQRLKRVYYSAFSPIPDASSKLPLISPPLIREHRLYQADWLLRFYGFKVEELTTAAAPDLSLTQDPKLSWALRNRAGFPVDINRASREILLRIPGLGVKNVDRILQIRRWHSISLADLTRLRVPLKKALPFIIASDHIPKLIGEIPVPENKPAQLELFAASSPFGSIL